MRDTRNLLQLAEIWMRLATRFDRCVSQQRLSELEELFSVFLANAESLTPPDLQSAHELQPAPSEPAISVAEAVQAEAVTQLSPDAVIVP